MKTNITTFALMAIITSSAFAALKAPMPEFKNEKQLAEWRATKAEQPTSQGYAKEEPAFYTGKPYLASSGNYAFKYRSYDPEIARWTSEDPSGFPDGANVNVYAPNPTSELDFMGLWRTTLVNTGDASQNTPAHTTGATGSIDGRGVLSATNSYFNASSNMLGQFFFIFGSAFAEISGDVSVNRSGKILVSTKPIDTDSVLFTKAYVTTSVSYNGVNEATIQFTWGGSILGSASGGGASLGGAAIDKSFVSLTYIAVE